MCGDCKYFKPKDYLPGLEPYGVCQCPHGGFKGETRYDYSAACKHGELSPLY